MLIRCSSSNSRKFCYARRACRALMPDDVDHSLHIVREKATQVMRDGRHRVVDVAIIQPAQMRGDDDVFHIPEWMIGSERLGGEDVQCRTGDLFLLQGLDQGALVDDAAA